MKQNNLKKTNRTKKVTIISKFEIKNENSFNEGTVKQTLYFSKFLKQKNYEVKVIFPSKNEKKFYKENILYEGKKLKNRIKIETDSLHLFGVPSIEFFLTLQFSKYKKTFLHVFDGEIGAFYNNKLFMLIRKLFFKKIDYIIVNSNYQKKLLLKKSKLSIKEKKELEKKITILPPFIGIKLQNKKSKERQNIKSISKNFKILYMSSLKDHKGINLLLNFFKKYKEKNKLEITIANSHFSKEDKKIVEEIKKLKTKYKNNIILKGKIDPLKELKKNHLYFYVFKKRHSTFSIPISLYEAISVNIPFLSSNFESLKEYFNEKALVKPEEKEVEKKLKEIIKNYKEYKKLNFAKIKLDDEKTFKKIEELITK